MSVGRRLATGVNAVLVAALVLAAVAVAVELAERRAVRVDLSADALATLDPDTVAALDLLDERDAAVVVTAFSAQAKDAEAWVKDRMMRDFLATLAHASPRVTTSFVDFDRDRLTAERLGVDRYGTVVIEGRADRVDVIDRELFKARGKKGERDVTFVGESAVAAGIRQVMADRGRTLYLLSGHGEAEIWDRGLGELKALAARVDDQGWTARTIDLQRDAAPGTAPAVPTDAAAVLLLGPKAPLAAVEAEALRAFLGRGGSVGLFVEPGAPAPTLLDDLGVAVPDGIVLDPVSQFPHVDRPLLQYGRHEITTVLLEDAVPTVVSVAAPLALSARDGVAGGTLLQTSRRGWVERGTEQPATYTAGVDGEGPVTVAAALTVARPVAWMGQGKTGRVVVAGDVDLLRDELLEDSPGNATFVTNALRWLVRTDERMARVGRPARVRRLELGEARLDVVRWLLLGLMPALAVVGGLAVAFARRDR